MHTLYRFNEYKSTSRIQYDYVCPTCLAVYYMNKFTEKFVFVKYLTKLEFIIESFNK